LKLRNDEQAIQTLDDVLTENPLQQGLKQKMKEIEALEAKVLTENPLQQGLKPMFCSSRASE